MSVSILIIGCYQLAMFSLNLVARERSLVRLASAETTRGILALRKGTRELRHDVRSRSGVVDLL